MNTLHLENILLKDRNVGPEFRGVFPLDHIPKKLQHGAYVFYTISSMQTSAGHWVAVWNDEYFDSYGREPIKELKSR